MPWLLAACYCAADDGDIGVNCVERHDQLLLLDNSNMTKERIAFGIFILSQFIVFHQRENNLWLATSGIWQSDSEFDYEHLINLAMSYFSNNTSN